ncbi:MAG: NADH-quinone oxidoreductase subunit NuoK [Spirochaetia bacterium]|nr:NADH-quinone oxidoreductase subunit NuoK [Spirochaetia bacterium]
MAVFSLQSCLILSAMLILIGCYGLIMRRSLLLIFLSVEIVLNGTHIALVAFNYFRWSGVEAGHYLYMVSIGVAAVEAAVGLSMIIVIFKNYGTIIADSFTSLRAGDKEKS